jgi:hypothetical protein
MEGSGSRPPAPKTLGAAMPYRITVTFVGGRRAPADFEVIGPTPKKGDKLVVICNRKRTPATVTKVTLTPPVDLVEADQW